MTDQQMIEAIAKAIAATRGRGVEPNSSDRDFAEKFLAAYRAAWKLEQEQQGQAKAASAAASEAESFSGSCRRGVGPSSGPRTSRASSPRATCSASGLAAAL